MTDLGKILAMHHNFIVALLDHEIQYLFLIEEVNDIVFLVLLMIVVFPEVLLIYIADRTLLHTLLLRAIVVHHAGNSLVVAPQLGLMNGISMSREIY